MSEDPFRPQEPAPDPDAAATTAERIVAWVRVHATPRRVIMASVFVIMWCAMLTFYTDELWAAWSLVSVGPSWEGANRAAEGYSQTNSRRAAAVCANAALMAIVLAVIS